MGLGSKAGIHVPLLNELWWSHRGPGFGDSESPSVGFCLIVRDAQHGVGGETKRQSTFDLQGTQETVEQRGAS